MNSDPDGQDPDRLAEPGWSTQAEIEYRINLESYFQERPTTCVEKLQNFAKYVPRQTLSQFLARYELFKMVLYVHGSLVECGVMAGGGLMTFAQLSSILEPVNYQRQIIGFDTFSGFPSLSEKDAKGRSVNAIQGGLAVDAYDDLKRSIELFDSNRYLGHIPKVALVKGDVKDTVPQYLDDHPHTVVSLLYLDLDLYEPTRVALEFFVPRMPKGAIIAFDELNHELWPGETLAVINAMGLNNLRLQRFTFVPGICYAILP